MEEEAPLILVDANLLVYAFGRQHPQHEDARAWLECALAGPTQVGLPWESLLAFVRIVSNPRIQVRTAPIREAWAQVERWLDAPVAWIPLPTERHRETLGTVLALVGAGTTDVHDAHLAAIALQHGLTVCSADSDFARFPGVRWENPLAG